MALVCQNKRTKKEKPYIQIISNNCCSKHHFILYNKLEVVLKTEQQQWAWCRKNYILIMKQNV